MGSVWQWMIWVAPRPSILWIMQSSSCRFQAWKHGAVNSPLYINYQCANWKDSKKRKWQNIAEVPHKPQLPLVLFSHLKNGEYVRNLFLSQWLHLASTSIRGHLAQFEKKACTHTVHARTTRWKDTNAHTFTAGGPLSSFAVASFLLLCPNWWLLPAWPLWGK